MAADFHTIRASSAFKDQLKTLCLTEFPCGTGSWRELDFSKCKTKTGTKTRPLKNEMTDGRFAVTLKDYGAGHEKTETLKEQITSKSSPWNLDYSWSKEAKELREIAVSKPWLIDDKFILTHFKTLRILDKNVSEVDEDLLSFDNLEELALSANAIVGLNSRNLPQQLKVLELCANCISDLSGLCVRPPPLTHLGLGYNRLSFIGDYITGDYWPFLLSLDLSNNSLSDLLDCVRKLETLPKLRNLMLIGNPLSLTPGYRGYTIDTLRGLMVLDDVRISADEKHHYKGLARHREQILDEAKLIFEVHHIKGVPMPEELKHPEDFPEYPIIERKYFVQFLVLTDKSPSRNDILTFGDDNLYVSGSQRSESREDAGTEVRGQTPTNPSAQGDRSLAPSILSTGRQSSRSDGSSTEPSVPVIPLKSSLLPWAEEIELNWSETLIRDDLVGLRDFIKQGIEFSVMEEKILANPRPESVTETTPTDDKAKKKDDKVGKDDKKKDDKAKGGGGGKDKKKKKDAEEELVRSPPEYTTIASFFLQVEEFLEGEHEIESVFSKSLLEDAEKTEDDAADGGKKKTSPKKKKVPTATLR